MNPLIKSLFDPKVYDHTAGTISLQQTHISWVLLVGDYAYKIKKPVNFGFLDFSTLDKRHFYCNEELRLNRRLAPDLYLDVVAITGTPHRPRINGPGSAFEYAVKMRRFPNECLLDRLIEENRLETGHIDALADEIATFHARVERAGATDNHGIPENIHASVLENFDQILPFVGGAPDTRRLAALQEWCEAEFTRIRTLMQTRKKEGFVRECHGDLHLGNIVLIDHRPTLFDCIEFSEKLRWIDVISEVAFIVMDLMARSRPNLSYRLLNRYLFITGDYPGLQLLRYYLFYRAIVRAKIAMLSLAAADNEAQQALIQRYRTYIELAESSTRPTEPILAITHGLSGSGKSVLAAKLSEHMKAVWLRSDVERKRLAGYCAHADTRSDIAGGIYSEDMSRTTYTHLADTARLLLQSGLSVIVDAAFLKRWQRDCLLHIAQVSRVPLLILDSQAPLETLRARVRNRLKEKKDPSEADLQVLEDQRRQREPLDATELRRSLTIDATTSPDSEGVFRRIRRFLSDAR
ncbi:MAG: AAA family ATPase [Pseudomonadota bacterium]